MTNETTTRGLVQGALALLRDMIAASPRETVATAVLMLVLSVTEGATVVLLAPLLELVGVFEQSPLPRASRWLRPLFGVVGVEPTLGSVLVLFVAIAAVRAMVLQLQARQSATLRENLVASARIRLFRAMAGAEWRFLVTRKPAQFEYMLIYEIARVGAAAGYIIDLIVAALISVVYLALALRLSTPMALLVLSCAALLGLVVRRSLDQARTLAKAAATERAHLHGAITEHIAAMKLSKGYGLIDRQIERVSELAGSARQFAVDASTSEADLNRLLDVGSTMLLAFVVYVSAVILEQPSAILLVMLFIFVRLMPRVLAVYRYARVLASNIPIYDNFEALARECGLAAEHTVGTPQAITLRSGIRLTDVGFTYATRDVPALDGVSMEIGSGQTVAIVGASGSGKSTVADVLLGLLAPDSGVVTVDGEPLTADRLPSWRDQVGYVPQDTFLFDASVRDNLKWAQRTASDADIHEALRLASADEFVNALPQGLETLVGHRGVLLSGGERQRLAIARALLRRPKVLILDEATNALDAENEDRIQDAIERLHRRMTIVIIAHRARAIQHADRIYLMQGGRIASSGTWASMRHDLLADELRVT